MKGTKDFKSFMKVSQGRKKSIVLGFPQILLYGGGGGEQRCGKILLRGRDKILASLSDFEFSDKGKEIFSVAYFSCKTYDFFLRLMQ